MLSEEKLPLIKKSFDLKILKTYDHPKLWKKNSTLKEIPKKYK